MTLFNRRGGSGNNLTNTRFDDEAGTAIASGAAPFSGTYRPDGLLSAFDGQSTMGTWTLRVTDSFRLDTGRLTGWSITASGTVGAGGQSVYALGFLDEVVNFDESDPEPLFESGASDSAAPLEKCPPNRPPRTNRRYDTADDSAHAVFVWMGAESQSEFEAPPVVEQDFVERENRPALRRRVHPRAAGRALRDAVPRAGQLSASEEDVFEAFAVQ